MSIPYVVDGETPLDSAFFNPIIDRANGLADGSVPIALPGITAALGTYAPLQNMRAGVVNALDISGVDPTGSTNSRAGLATALAAAAGKVLDIPAGTYLCDASSTYGSVLGLTTANTEVWLRPGAVLKVMSQTGTEVIRVAAANCIVRGGTIDGNGVTDAIGIVLTSSADGATVEGVRFKGALQGISLSSADDVRIANNRFELWRYGVLVGSSATLARLQIHGNYFEGSAMAGGGDAIELNTPSGLTSDVSIIGNTIRNILSSTISNGLGIGLAQVVRATIAQNVLVNCGLDAIHIEDDATDISIIGNIAYDCDRSGIAVNTSGGAASLRGVVIMGNTIRGCNKNRGTGAIALESPFPLVPVNDCIVSGNMVTDCGRTGAAVYGIDLNSGSSGHRIVNNMVSGMIGTGAGLRLDDAVGVHVLGNHFTGNPYGIYARDTMTDVEIAHNYLKGNTNGACDESAIGVTSGYTKQDNIT